MIRVGIIEELSETGCRNTYSLTKDDRQKEFDDWKHLKTNGGEENNKSNNEKYEEIQRRIRKSCKQEEEGMLDENRR